MGQERHNPESPFKTAQIGMIVLVLSTMTRIVSWREGLN